MDSRMTTIKLYGHLGQRFGRIHHFAVQSPAEALRALKANFRDFAQYLAEHSAPGYRVVTDRGDRSVEQLAEPMGGASIKIVPYVAGAGNGVGQFILGAVLVGVGFIVLESPMLVQFGLAMMIGGVSQMLFAPPKPAGPSNGAVNQPSYAFNGAVNTSAQGNPVPVCYGRLLVGSQVISGGEYVSGI